MKDIAKIATLAVALPAGCLAWGAGFLAFSFEFQTPGSCFYLLVTAFLTGALAKRWW